MLIDELGLLRSNLLACDATETGATSATVRDADGNIVLDIRKTPQRGIPVVVIYSTGTGNSTNRTFTITIEACALENFGSGKEVVATFPAWVTKTAGSLMVRRVHTQKQYLRSVITVSTGDSLTISTGILIFVGHALMNT